MKTFFLALIAGSICNNIYNQQPGNVLTMDKAVELSLDNNPVLKNAELEMKSSEIFPFSVIEPGNAKIEYFHGQINSGAADHIFKVTQDLGSPLNHYRRIQYQKQLFTVAKAGQKMRIKEITAQVKTAYNIMSAWKSKVKIFHSLAPVYDQLLSVTGVPYQQNDSDLLSRSMTETLFASFQNEQYQAEQEYTISQNNLSLLVNTGEKYIPADTFLDIYAIRIRNLGPDKFSPASLSYYDESVRLQDKNIKMKESEYFPGISIGYFNQQIDNVPGYQGIYLGISVPLWFFPQKARVSQARINKTIVQNKAESQKNELQNSIETLKIMLDKYFVQISFYRENSLNQADLLLKDAIRQIQDRNINYKDCLEKLQMVRNIRLDYLETLRKYNEIAILLESYID